MFIVNAINIRFQDFSFIPIKWFLASIYSDFSLICPNRLCQRSLDSVATFASPKQILACKMYKDPSFEPLAMTSFHFPVPKCLIKLKSLNLPIEIRLRCISGTCLTSFSTSLFHVSLSHTISTITWFPIFTVS